jgi:protein-tyrosine-phosphatase
MKIKVLFLCASNSVQSPMAELLLSQLNSEHFEAVSAGIEGEEPHRLTVEVMKEIGLDIAGRLGKSLHDVRDVDFDFVISLCDRARWERSSFPAAEFAHWRFDDPLIESDPTRQRRLFGLLRDQLAQRIRLFALVQTRPATRSNRPRSHAGGFTPVIAAS